MIDDVGEDDKKDVVLTPLQSPPRAGFRLQHLMAGVVICAFLFWLWKVALAGLILIIVLVLMIGVAGVSVFFMRRTAVQQQTLLWALAISAERSLPMAPAVLAFGDQYGRAFRWRIQLLAGLLTRGTALTDALDQVPNLIKREALVLIATGSATGTLPRALRDAAGLRTERENAWRGLAVRFLYLIILFGVIQGTFTYLSYFIWPRYRAIMQDFGVRIPALTEAVIGQGQFFFDNNPWIPVVVGSLELGMLVLFPLIFFNYFEWNFGLLDSLFRRRHANLVLRGLALAVGGERPILDGMTALARSYPSKWVRTRLRGVATDVRGGEPWTDSLVGRGLLRRNDAAVLASAERVGNLDWALRETAAAGERKIGYQLQFWLQILYPVVLLGLGVLVFLAAVAYFLPLIAVIEALQ